MAARPIGQPRTARGRRGRGRGPGRRPHRLPGQPRHRGAAGRRRPRQHRVAAGPVGQPHKLGDVAVAAGDLAAARTAYQASLDIRLRLAAADPANTGWQRDLSVSHKARGRRDRGRGPGRRPHRLPGQPRHRVRLAAADPANTEWQRDLSVSHEGSGTSRPRPGTWPPPAPPTRPALDIRAADRRRPRQHRMAAGPVGQPRTARGRRGRGRGPGRRPHRLPGQPRHRVRLAAADPANTQWQRDLSVSHNKLGDVAAAAGDLAAARTAYQAALDIGAAGRRRPRQHRVAAGPVGQPQQARGCCGRGRGPGRRPHRLPGRLDIAVRLAAADPANTGWQRDLEAMHQKIDDLSGSSGPDGSVPPTGSTSCHQPPDRRITFTSFAKVVITRAREVGRHGVRPPGVTSTSACGSVFYSYTTHTTHLRNHPRCPGGTPDELAARAALTGRSLRGISARLSH